MELLELPAPPSGSQSSKLFPQQKLLAHWADMREWPLPWTSFALGAIPRELPHRSGGRRPKVFGPPFYRKLSPADAPSEQHRQSAVPISKNNRPLSPPAPAPSARLTELGWTDPIATYSMIAKEETTFLLHPYESLDRSAQARIKWHKCQCHLGKVTDFLLFVEQHSFLLLYIKLVGTLALACHCRIPTDEW